MKANPQYSGVVTEEATMKVNPAALTPASGVPIFAVKIWPARTQGHKRRCPYRRHRLKAEQLRWRVSPLRRVPPEFVLLEPPHLFRHGAVLTCTLELQRTAQSPQCSVAVA